MQHLRLKWRIQSEMFNTFKPHLEIRMLVLPPQLQGSSGGGGGATCPLLEVKKLPFLSFPPLWRSAWAPVGTVWSHKRVRLEEKPFSVAHAGCWTPGVSVLSDFVKLSPIKRPTCFVHLALQRGHSLPTAGKLGSGVHCKLLSGLFLMGL